jgi:TolB-like protein/DNA-binding winged helix-turn-helix (wHTH) protein/lipopolysaccharide biosynthesis regulator YciM
MTIRDADSLAPMRAKRLRFDHYVLDLDRGCLVLDGNDVVLRPKTFAVLHYLIENSGRLVSKDELFAAVWSNLAVTDDALVQSVGELRRAFGEDGPRLIRTIPRRGYRFEGVVSDADQHVSAMGPMATTEVVSSQGLIAQTSRNWRTYSIAGLGFAVALTAATVWSSPIILNATGIGDWFGRQRPALAAKPAIAVLPFANQSDDASRDYFADGLTQDILSALGRFSALTVMSWNAVLPFKGKEARPADLGRRLSVRYLVEGSVRQDGDRVRVTAQLADTEHGQLLWSARFDEALIDVFTLQDKITTQIVGALALRVTQIEQRRVFAKPTENLEAYDYVLRARPAMQRPTRINNVEARAFLRRAIELDPKYAAAYAALAETYHIAMSMGWAQSPTVFLNRAEELATEALSLDGSEVRARIILARAHIFHQRYKQAEVEIERALTINSNDANGLAGRGNILLWLGKTDAAIEALQRAQHIDPEINAIDRFALSLAYYLKRRYDEAIELAEINLRKTAAANFSRVLLAASYAQLDRAVDAERVVTEIRRFDPTFDSGTFGSKFLSPADLEHLREGIRKAGL